MLQSNTHLKTGREMPSSSESPGVCAGNPTEGAYYRCRWAKLLPLEVSSAPGGWEVARAPASAGSASSPHSSRREGRACHEAVCVCVCVSVCVLLDGRRETSPNHSPSSLLSCEVVPMWAMKV